MAFSETPYGQKVNDAMSEETRPIGLMASNCRELFEKSVLRLDTSQQDSLIVQLTRQVKEFRDRFDAWGSFLAVFDTDRACLDCRVRNHPVLQDMIIRLLDTLRRNIFLVGYYPVPSAAGGLGTMPDIQSEDGSSLIEVPENFRVAFSGIFECITRLNQLGIAIRSSSKSTATARARRFAAQNPDLIALHDFENRAYIYVSILYPNAEIGLRNQLVHSMTDRYAKIKYEAYRTGAATEFPTTSKPTSTTSKPTDPEKARAQPHSLMNFKQDHPKQTFNKSRGGADNMTVSSLDTKLLESNLKKMTTNDFVPKCPQTLIGKIDRAQEPPLPKFEGESRHTTCKWCYQIIDRTFIRKDQFGYIEWSEVGRRHYKSDLQPYVCIAEECSESRPSFAASQDWIRHMNSTHSEFWVHTIYNKESWVCKKKHENDSCYVFSTKDDLYSHIVLHHPEDGDIDQYKDNMSFPNSHRVETRRQDSSCPLCLFSFKTDYGNVEPVIVTDQTKQTLFTSTEKDTQLPLASLEMHKHIAEHLHYLMLVSLRIMSMIDTSSDSDSEAGREIKTANGDLSEIPEAHWRNRLKSLPSDVQGSIAWSDLEAHTVEEDDTSKSEKPRLSFYFTVNQLFFDQCDFDIYFNSVPPTDPTRYVAETPSTVMYYFDGNVAEAQNYLWSRDTSQARSEGNLWHLNPTTNQYDSYLPKYKCCAVFACNPLLPIMVCPMDPLVHNSDFMWSLLQIFHPRHLQGVSQVAHEDSLIGQGPGLVRYVASSRPSWIPSLLPSTYKWPHAVDPPPSRGLGGELPIILGLMALSAEPDPNGQNSNTNGVFLGHYGHRAKWKYHQWHGDRARGHPLTAEDSPRGFLVTVFLDPNNPVGSSVEALRSFEWEQVIVTEP